MVAETKLYSSLGIQPEATQDEIKKAYRYVNTTLPLCFLFPYPLITSHSL